MTWNDGALLTSFDARTHFPVIPSEARDLSASAFQGRAPPLAPGTGPQAYGSNERDSSLRSEWQGVLTRHAPRARQGAPATHTAGVTHNVGRPKPHPAGGSCAHPPPDRCCHLLGATSLVRERAGV